MNKKLTFVYLYDFRNPLPWQRPWSEVYAETLQKWGQIVRRDRHMNLRVKVPSGELPIHPGSTAKRRCGNTGS